MTLLKFLRFGLILLGLVALQLPATAYGDEKKPVKIHFEEECRAFFSPQVSLATPGDNETKVEQAALTIHKTTVTEIREGGVVDTYIRFHDCRLADPG